MKNKECPICGVGLLEKRTITETFTYKGESMVIPNYVIWLCFECKESIVDSETLKKSGKILRDFMHKLEDFQ